MRRKEKILWQRCTTYKDSCDTKLFEFWIEEFLIPTLKPGQMG
ncbi:hypothetical protein MIDIC_480013 [Alphaproteobacteria bacterium]